ncbi:hypothetical protein SteCoe_24161 [Stentor coeruleus]|uniref:Histidine phosphatase family protein n=1 Tax=Stentor coeruleus TaxID=5963 RepID=A0A1R2BIA5_9CILI|nr:hypothetical protein SteCoe_24161 [Stentor coeruleus]
MKKKVITLIRHAESENNLFYESPNNKNILKLTPDPGITQKGIIQAEKLGHYFKENENSYNFDLIISSPMKRAIESSSIIFNKSNAEKTIWDTVFEAKGPYSKNDKSCIKRSEFKKKFPEYSLPDTIKEQGWYSKNFSESVYATFNRARRVLNTLINDQSHNNIAIVSHCIFISIILRILLFKHIFIHFSCKSQLSPPNTSLSTFIILDKNAYIKELMISPHLENNLIIP